VLGVSNLTVAGQAWISHRVDYRWRARSFGLYETSWAIALLAGAPIVAVLINLFGWRGPFIAIAIACVLAAILVGTTLPAHQRPSSTRSGRAGRRRRCERRRRCATAAIRTDHAAGLARDDRLSNHCDGRTVGVRGVGDLARRCVRGVDRRDRCGGDALRGDRTRASLGSAAFADRLGKLRTTVGGLGLLLVGLTIMVGADDRLWMGTGGLVVFLLGFELAFVVSLSLVSESMPDARGATLAVSNAVGTVARAGGAVLSGWLYGIHGIGGTAGLSAAAAIVAVGSLTLSRRMRRARR
jgi:predicted MFS family arabinose efflux permease